jgi:hypothetical protein
MNLQYHSSQYQTADPGMVLVCPYFPGLQSSVHSAYILYFWVQPNTEYNFDSSFLISSRAMCNM